MTVKEFIEARKALTSEMLIKALYEKLNIRTYLPMTIKEDIIEEMCNQILKEKDGMFTYNSIEKCVVFMIVTLSTYTDLQISDTREGRLADYDMLSYTGELDIILSMIDEDFKEFAQLFELRFNDKLRERNDLVAVLNNQLTGLINYITPIFEQVGSQMKSIDINGFNEIVNKHKEK